MTEPGKIPGTAGSPPEPVLAGDSAAREQLSRRGDKPGGATAPVKISAIAPLFNEAENVLPLARRTAESLAQVTGSFEVILVDDGSSDETWKRILEARRADARVRPLRHKRRSGQSAALWSGCSAARGEIICTLDGDLQNDPADLPGMIALLKDYDLVCGHRTNRKDSGIRKISSRIARWARKAALGVDFRDTGCNLRAFKRSLLPKLLPFDGLHRFMPILAHIGGAKVMELPVCHHPRQAGKSKYGVWNRLGRGIFDLFAMAWYRRRQISTVEAVEFEDPGIGH